MTWYTLWLARDQDGGLRIFDEEPDWGETRWFRPYATVRNPKPPNTTTWERQFPPRKFPELKPGWKVRLPLGPFDSAPVRGEPG